MSATLSIITPSYSADLERCRLLCDSIDRFVTGYDTHFIVVGDEDETRFAPLATPRRKIVAHSSILPRFHPIGRWRRRGYWWAPGAGLPVYGWHLQQLRKFAMTLAQENGRTMCIDSDNCFIRELDLSGIATATSTPLYHARGEVDASRPDHVKWTKTAHDLLGLTPFVPPGDDYVGQMIVWSRDTVAAILGDIESHAGRPWWASMAQKRDFSEYIIYGVAVSARPDLMAKHELTERSSCLAYWQGPALDETALRQLIAQMAPDQSAIAIQSHTGTGIDLIRRVALG
jgi:hypothetical protein